MDIIEEPVACKIPKISKMSTSSKEKHVHEINTINLRWVRNLVFQGGSVKGVSYGGAVGALGEALKCSGFDLDGQIERVAGTSAGAITALALALGTEVAELVDTIGNTDIKSFLDTKAYEIVSNISNENSSAPSKSSSAFAGIPLLTTSMGLASGQNILTYLEDFTQMKTGVKCLTFGELHDLVVSDGTEAGKKGRRKDLFVVAYNLTLDTPQVFNFIDTPDSVISDAVRCSMSIPFVFVPHKNYVKKKVEGEDVRVEASEDLWIDGGITDNYPIWVFDKLFNHPFDATLGFYLVSKEEKDEIERGHLPTHIPVRREVKNILDYAKAVIETVVSSQQTAAHKQGRDVQRTVYIDHLGTSMMNFGLTPDEKNALVASGWDSTCGRLGLDHLIGHCQLIIKTPEEIQKLALAAQHAHKLGEISPSDQEVPEDKEKVILNKCIIS